MKLIRIGFGYDVHAFAKGRKLLLGGVEIPHEKGLKGHSDADVLLHAIIDALLGALALGDIGQHFPDTDPEFKDADSKKLLRHCYKLITDRGYYLANLDATVIAEQPKLLSHIPKIRSSISKQLSCEVDNISVKATTSEKMGFVGRNEGIAVMTTVLLYSSGKDNG